MEQDYEEVIIEADVGYFYPAGKELREIYGGGVAYRLAFVFPVDNHWNIYVAGDYFYKNGQSEGVPYTTHIRIVPVSLGVRYNVPLGCHIDFFAAIGPRYVFANAQNNAPGVDVHNSASNWGGDATIGFLIHPVAYPICNQWVFNIFVNYSYSQCGVGTALPNVTTYNVNVGGWTAGGGVGYRF